MQVSRWIWPAAGVAFVLVVALWPDNSPPRREPMFPGADAPIPASDDGAPSISLTAMAQRATPTGTIPDGTYECKIWSGSSYISLGTIRSRNNSLDTQLLAKVGATFTGAQATPEGITVSYTTARGYRESMDCTRQ